MMAEEQHDFSRRKFGDYVCLKLIGIGGQSAVYTAMHTETGRNVALRIMNVTVANVEHAIQECQYVLEDIQHLYAPNTVKIDDFGADGDLLYIVMPHMHGGSLQYRLEATPPDTRPSPNDVLQLVERMATALDDLHSKGVVHGQVEPRSIMFDDAGFAYLGDVGMTKLIKIIFKLDVTNSFSMTQYSAPELWRGERPSPQTDQYALACIVYELLTGKAPFEAPSIFDLMNAHTSTVVTPPHYVRQDLPDDLAVVFWKALAKPVNKRYKSITTFYDALYKAFEGQLGDSTDFFSMDLG